MESQAKIMLLCEDDSDGKRRADMETGGLVLRFPSKQKQLSTAVHGLVLRTPALSGSEARESNDAYLVPVNYDLDTR